MPSDVATIDAWLNDNPWIPPYVSARIRASVDNVADVLARCPDLRFDRAIDVGSGPGLDTLGLALHFGEVVGIDKRYRTIRLGRKLARTAPVAAASFERLNSERMNIEPADLVWCNLMSHSGRSRVRLSECLGRCTRDGGWLVYSEETEGYAMAEVHRALARRDVVELAGRLRQLRNGLSGRSGWRFFASGTARSVFERAGFSVHHHEVTTWHRVPVVERWWLRRDRTPQPVEPRDDDYVDLPPDFDAARALARAAFRHRRGAAHMELRGGEWTPLAGYLEMSRVVPGADRRAEPLVHRLRRYARQPPALPEPAWAAAAELESEILSLLVRDEPVDAVREEQ